jgi:hypothetical protein
VPRMRRINISLPEWTLADITDESKRLGVSMADVVRMRLRPRIERGTPGNDDATGTQGRTSTRRFPRTPA